VKRPLAAAAAVTALVLPASGSGGTPLTVFAAASLTEVLPRIDESPRFSFAGSDQLAIQIQQGAPADVFAAASAKQPDRLFRNGLVRKPVVFVTNRLVVLVPRGNPAHIRTVYDLRRDGVKIVIGDRAVPIGVYTRQILGRLGIASQITKNVVSEESDVKGIVTKVALGEADAGFVYRTDAKPVASRTRSVALPAGAQPAIRYEVAIVRSSSRQQAAAAFVKKLLSKRGRLALKQAGFGLPKRP
jgi:molybdate transport system substrate-binding protein